MDEEITCAICQKSLDNVNDVITLRQKGSEGINRASTERNDLIQTVPSQKVHQRCRREYCHPSYINRAKKKERESSISSRRSLDRKTEAKTNSFDLYFKPEPKANSRRRVWNMKKVKEQLGDDVCHDLLFLHAILGCDTTSRVHGIGKAAALKKYANSLHFREQAKVFNSPSTVDDIVVVGEKALRRKTWGETRRHTLPTLL
ncbi:unnamed protein product [Porites evermanni]|uniref:Uncharacterized protein n=1 Tax=Porites evermanni TaxID=104178 RepID=A0ABN8M4E4_9CNID|nr:unnamed protein product [Porites evermanni]